MLESDAMRNNVARAELDVLLIGHITQDLLGQDLDSGYRIGGTVSFAAVTALCLGRQPTILTRAAATTDLSELLSNIVLQVLHSPQTTTFANVYTSQGRVQYSYTQALPITTQDVPNHLRSPRIALLGPLVNEIQADVAAIFDKQTLVAAVPQGWMRRWDGSGRVFSKEWESAEEILPHLDVLVLSQEDIDYDLDRLALPLKYVPLVVMTEYRDGSTIFLRGTQGNIEQFKVSPRPANEIDPTGAGDIFAAAFLIRLQETSDPVQSARFANITASFGVEAQGVSGIPTRARVLTYMNQHPFSI